MKKISSTSFSSDFLFQSSSGRNVCGLRNKLSLFLIGFVICLAAMPAFSQVQIITYSRTEDFGDLPVGLSIIQIVDGAGAGAVLGMTITGAMTPNSDPDFSIISAGCTITDYGNGAGPQSACTITVLFAPRSSGRKQGTVIGHIRFSPYTAPGSTYTQPGLDETDTIHLSGTGTGVTPKLDLSIQQINISQPHSTTTSDGSTIVSPNAPTQINVQVSGSGFNSPENRSAVVSLQIGSQSFQSSINLASLAASGSLTLPFTVQFSPDDIGIQAVTATIDPGNALQEANFSNNISSVEMQVQCNVSEEGTKVPSYSQVDPSWATNIYDHQAPQKMSALGCATSSASMLLNSYGLSKDPINLAMTPGQLNVDLNNWGVDLLSPLGRGYTPSGGVVWQSVVEVGRASAAFQCITSGGSLLQCAGQAQSKISFKGIQAFDQKAVNKEICSGNPVILAVPSHSDASRNHFVIATGTAVNPAGKQQTFFIDDPGFINGKDSLLSPSYTSIRGVRLFKPAADPTMFFTYGSENIDFVVTDPVGKRSGFNPITNETFNEIPNANYLVESIGSDDPSEAGKGTPFERSFENMSALEGAYTIDVYTKSGGAYYLMTNGYDSNGSFNNQSNFSGTLKVQEHVVLKYVHSSASLPIFNADISLRSSTIKQSRKSEKYKVLAEGRIKLKNSSATEIGFKSSVQILIGGVTGFNVTIPKAQFHSHKEGHETNYSYKSSDHKLSVEISSDGHFTVYGKNLDLSFSPALIRDVLVLKIDDLAGQAKLKSHHSDFDQKHNDDDEDRKDER